MKFTNNSSECADKARSHTSELLQGCDLDLPIEPDFVSKPPRVDPQLMFDRSEEMLKYQVSQAGFYERRRADKIDVEFVL